MSSLHFSPWPSQPRLLPAKNTIITIITITITIITTITSETGPLTGGLFHRAMDRRLRKRLCQSSVKKLKSEGSRISRPGVSDSIAERICEFMSSCGRIDTGRWTTPRPRYPDLRWLVL